jgi:hypothetical protein
MDAANLYSQRDLNNTEPARKAAEIYKKLAQAIVNPTMDEAILEKANLLIDQSESVYFVGDNISDIEKKKELHLLGKDICIEATTLLEQAGQAGQPKKDSFAETYALALYWKSANMARWGEANGVVASLGQWPELEKDANTIIDLGFEQIKSYGPARVLGRAFFKLPYPLGDLEKSKKYLEDAFYQSIDEGQTISRYDVNVTYYAEVLIALGDDESVNKAVTILNTFVSLEKDPAALKAYNADRVPETKKEIQRAKLILESL